MCDALGRLIRKRTDDGVTAYAYDHANNLLSIAFTDKQGEEQQLDYAYDALGQLLSETDSAGLLQYNYDRKLHPLRRSPMPAAAARPGH